MKLLCTIIILFFAFACQSGKVKPTSNDIADTLINKGESNKSEADFVSKMNYKVYAKLFVEVLSRDSILVKTTLVNDSDRVVTLFKPNLPTDRPAGCLFQINYSDSPDSIVHFIDSVKGLSFTKNSNPYLPLFRIFPGSAAKDATVDIQPKQKIDFLVNIAKQYDFNTLLKRNIKDFTIYYFVWMPVIENGKHIFESTGSSNIQLPVYIGIGSELDKSNKIMLIKFHFPS